MAMSEERKKKEDTGLKKADLSKIIKKYHNNHGNGMISRDSSRLISSKPFSSVRVALIKFLDFNLCGKREDFGKREE